MVGARPLAPSEVGCWRSGCSHVGTLAGLCPCHSPSAAQWPPEWGRIPCREYVRQSTGDAVAERIHHRQENAAQRQLRGLWQAQRAATFVIAEQRRTGVPPTVREVGSAMGLSSSSTIQKHLEHAVDLGLLSHTEGGVSRPFRAPVVEGHCGACGQALGGR